MSMQCGFCGTAVASDPVALEFRTAARRRHAERGQVLSACDSVTGRWPPAAATARNIIVRS